MSPWVENSGPFLAIGECLFPEGDDRSLFEAQDRIEPLTARIEATARRVPAAVCHAKAEVHDMVASYQD